jgi:UDP-3-O-[3-hydroxymyristoyl] glucosamine N-acyltransferase
VKRRLGELADRVGGAVQGDRERPIAGLAALETAGPEELSFLANPQYLEAARASRAGALLVARPFAGLTCDLVVVADPYLAFARLLADLHEPAAPAPGIHATAVVDASAEIDPTAAIGPYAVVGEHSRVGARAELMAHVVVGRDCRVGEDCVLHPHVVLYDRTVLGERTILHAGVVLGSDGFGYAPGEGKPFKIPQVGRVVVGAEVEIGANSTVDRATLGETTIGDATKIDNLVQVGHNVAIGRSAILCGQVGIAGSARLGDGVVMGGQSGSSGHLEIGAGVKVAGKTAVFAAVPAGQTVAGIPAIEIGSWRRQQALLKRLQELFRRLRRLEERVGGVTNEEGDRE